MILELVGPDEIQISTPTRPPAEPWVIPPSPEKLESAASIFGSVAKVLQPVDVNVESGIDEEVVDAVLAIVSRHPMEESELVRTLARWVPGRVMESLTTLAACGKIREIERFGRQFWYSAGSHFPDQKLTRKRLQRSRGTQSTAGLST